MRRPLEEAGQDIQMVESLGPMWDEEKLRIGHSPPTPPPGPERNPEPLCAYVEHIRAQFQVPQNKQQASSTDSPCQMQMCMAGVLFLCSSMLGVMWQAQSASLCKLYCLLTGLL